MSPADTPNDPVVTEQLDRPLLEYAKEPAPAHKVTPCIMVSFACASLGAFLLVVCADSYLIRTSVWVLMLMCTLAVAASVAGAWFAWPTECEQDARWRDRRWGTIAVLANVGLILLVLGYVVRSVGR